MTIQFYRHDAGDPLLCSPDVPEGYDVADWMPSRDGFPPAELGFAARIWWLFDRLGVFANRHCGILVISCKGEPAHRSLVTPRWYRFAMMAPDDLQIGATWTHPAHRGKGLAGAAVALIDERWNGKFTRMWYVVDAANLASVRVIERCGFRLAGSGRRTRPLGLAAIGRFIL